MSTKFNMCLLVFVIVLTSMLIACWETRPPQKINTYPSPETAQTDTREGLPSFSFETTDGQSHDVANFRGKVVLMNFWASWCVPCIAEFPVLLKIAEIYPDRLVLLAFSNDMNVAAIQSFTERLEPEVSAKLRADNVLMIWDENMRITQDLFGIFQLPETILVAPDGNIAHKFIGVDWSADDMQTRIDTALKN